MQTDESAGERLAALERQVACQQAEIETLRQSERRYREVFEQANDLVHSVDSEGRILYVNILWRQTLGYSEAEARRLRIFDIVDPSCGGKCQGIFASLMRGERTPPTETVFIAKDGRKIMVEGRCTPKFEEGRAVELLGIFRDISERKRLEAEREALIVDLKEALARVKTLEGYLPICASCKKIRDDQGYWKQVEDYLRTHTNADFTHGICPDCARTLYPQFVVSRKGKTD